MNDCQRDKEALQKEIEQEKLKTTSQVQHEKFGEGIDEKLDQLVKFTGRNKKELVELVKNNKELTVGQLYDKAVEQKLI
ncbi:hypothetical protein IMG5_167570 [Ichthyophthirius multifiliis]|uniref:Uncharacterized protein n=1 Tax=Ichthyophthirius multifiliis TaxID=5932 RepID=G0R0Y3_ICHMU|nr:hypothetical protein IMG5_167570 [Ichthyophthirius multifiliis]EGR28848.1 hypothetical protein IMG5_167570 [Ichthyophthirius multifiliis]|eukprot:XP_004030084.1 hypothetical protein IMG5_167570 [Ichthyophthirius multifiliis]